MRTSLSKTELKNDLLYDTLEALAFSLSQLKLPLYVVGATARDIIMKLLNEDDVRRRTNDLDVAIALQEWGEFDRVKESLESNHFIKVKNKQKFYYKGKNHENDFEVDVVPFGRIAENERICWVSKLWIVDRGLLVKHQDVLGLLQRSPVCIEKARSALFVPNPLIASRYRLNLSTVVPPEKVV